MSTSSSVSSPQQLRSPTCKCGMSAKLFTAMTIENGGRRFYKCRRLEPNSCSYWNWLDEKLPPHVSLMIHNQKVEIDSIRKERDHLKKIVEDMDGVEISDLKDMTAANESLDLEKEEKLSNLELTNGNRSADLKKADNLNDKVSKLELKVYQLISLLVVFGAVVFGFVAAKMM